MRIEALHVGMKVNHPQYGAGSVKSVNEHAAEIRFDDGMKTISPEASDLQPAEPQVAVTGLQQPLALFVGEIVQSLARELGLARPDCVVEELGLRWQKGKLVLHPADPAL